MSEEYSETIAKFKTLISCWEQDSSRVPESLRSLWTNLQSHPGNPSKTLRTELDGFHQRWGSVVVDLRAVSSNAQFIESTHDLVTNQDQTPRDKEGRTKEEWRADVDDAIRKAGWQFVDQEEVQLNKAFEFLTLYCNLRLEQSARVRELRRIATLMSEFYRYLDPGSAVLLNWRPRS